MAFAKKNQPKSKAVIARETESQIKAVRARLAEMREYKRLLAVDGIKPDQQDKERESALIVQLLRLERVGTPLPSYPKPQAPKAKAESRRGRGRGHGAKPQAATSNCQPEQACYVGPRTKPAKAKFKPAKAKFKPAKAKSFDKVRKPDARRGDFRGRRDAR